MRCYDHHGTEAVGVCKHCGKGVCSSCARDTRNGLACSEVCGEELKELAAVVNFSKQRVTGAGGKARTVWAGVAVVIFSAMLYRDFRSPLPDYTRVAITILLTSLSVYYLASGLRTNDGNN